MVDYELVWDDNLRTNLRLWPAPLPNIAALARQDGRPYDEADLLEGFPSDGDKFPTDTRAVRNTFEAMAHCGMSYRSGGDPDRFLLSDLGRFVMSFLGVIGDRTFSTPSNRPLLGTYLARALAPIIEVRAIWMLMLACDGRLSNEELNRCMNRIAKLSDVPETAEAVMRSRSTSNPHAIGPRRYRDEEFGTAGENNQRKAMNPHFLLAGGGGWLVDVDQTDPFRRMPPWAQVSVREALALPQTLMHASTDRSTVLRMSDRSGARW